MEPSAKAPRLASRRSARLQGIPPPDPSLPPPHWLNARCSPADERAPCCFAVLPDEVLFRVFVALPADARARCGAVCRAWALALLRGADAWRCWTRLDLSGSSGLTRTKSNAVLEGAAALARGHLQELDLTDRGAHGNRDEITSRALVRVLRGNPELRTLALDGVDYYRRSLNLDALQQLLAAAPPTLQRLGADCVRCWSSASSLPLLRAEPPYGPLRMLQLGIDCPRDPPDASIGAAVGARRFAAAVSHAWLRELRLSELTWAEPVALEALADALLSRTCRVEVVELYRCTGMSPAYLPSLTRLLAGRDDVALKKVLVYYHASLFEGSTEADVEAVGAALRRSTLTHVALTDVGLSEQSEAALRQAAAAAPRLRLDYFQPRMHWW